MWQEGSVLTIKDVRISGGMVHGTCPILVEGNEYIFRIKAVNKSSKGHWNYSIPSEPSDSMIAKIRYMKAFIHQPGMYDIELKKGHTFRYDIWFGGEPPPTVTWEREGTVIQPNERITLELMAKKTVFFAISSRVIRSFGWMTVPSLSQVTVGGGSPPNQMSYLKVWPFFSSMSYMPGWWMNAFMYLILAIIESDGSDGIE